MGEGWWNTTGGFGGSGIRPVDGGLADARADLAAVDSAVQEASDALRRATEIDWRSTAADQFRVWADALAQNLWSEARELDATALAATRLAVAG